jgi:hypothetical protein
MKRIVSIVLVAAILAWGPPRKAEAQMAPAVLVLVAAAAAGCIILWVYKTNTAAKRRCLVLQKSHYDGNWASVATNIMVVLPNLALAFPAFGDKMTDDTALYRVVEIPMPDGSYRVTLSPAPAGAWAYVYP